MAKHEFKVGDRVRIRQWEDMVREFGVDKYGDIDCPTFGFIERMKHLCGRTATIRYVYVNLDTFELDFDDTSGDTMFNYSIGMLEPVLPERFFVHCRTQEEYDKCKEMFFNPDCYMADWSYRGTDFAMRIENGKYQGCSFVAYYKNHQDEYGEIYTYPEIAALMGETTEESKNNVKMEDCIMNTFDIRENTRINKTNNTQIETITTIFKTTSFTDTPLVAYVTCDKSDYDERTGCLIAAAKSIASMSEETHLMYDIAINTWGTDISNAIFKTLADRACDGSFEKVYAKYLKTETDAYKSTCKCEKCGKMFDTPDKAREHEQWHIDNKKRRNERQRVRTEAKRRLASKEYEGKVAEMMQNILREKK